uniref:Endo/exonuclease/phosphatase domain-containing protein n=1 Tax=Angiostrongylus cantonensis TaxID=6313 RepID=A0A0K0D9W1_ANGCA
MEAAWITKNYGDDLYLQSTYTCIRVYDGGLAYASEEDKALQLTTRIGRLRLKRCGLIPAVIIFVVYASTSNYDEAEFEAFCTDLKKYREDHTFVEVIIGDINAWIRPRRTSEKRYIGTDRLKWNEQVSGCLGLS